MARTFGITYDVCVVPLGLEACGDFELPDPSWLESGSGTAVLWSAAQTDLLVEVPEAP